MVARKKISWTTQEAKARAERLSPHPNMGITHVPDDHRDSLVPGALWRFTSHGVLYSPSSRWNVRHAYPYIVVSSHHSIGAAAAPCQVALYLGTERVTEQRSGTTNGATILVVRHKFLLGDKIVLVFNTEGLLVPADT